MSELSSQVSTIGTVADAAQRAQALNPAESFIVQAPAGSGKTELLTQRFLRLLATVDEPEQVVAITFTRKAAAEMRNRIMGALESALEPQPTQAHELQTWQLASAALAQDEQHQWGLLSSPARLRVQTIDGLCGSLVRQMPVLSRLGGSPVTVDDARPLYQEAAERALREALSGNDKTLAATAHSVVVHLDGRFGNVTDLMALMLGKRDQWLRYLAGGSAQLEGTDYFAEAVTAIKRQALQSLAQRLTKEQRNALGALCLGAANNLETPDKMPALFAWRDVMENELAEHWNDEADSLALWLGAADCLLTAKGGYRSKRGLNKNYGFPAGTSGAALKQQHEDLVTELEQSVPDFDEQLQQLRGLPTGGALDTELAILPDIADLLRCAVVELKLLFSERNEVDHAEVTEMALAALGEADNPTDLALALDYRIQHVLADEVQDTSHNQFELFRRLTAGWQTGDGRSFFAVGDPMQSIYRFREADVGLFLQAWHHGLRADFPLTPLQLTVNFRSQAGVVNWVNQQFKAAFPSREDSVLGAICYAPSTAFHAHLEGAAVQWHIRHKADEQCEAEAVVETIKAALAENAEHSIAVLGRGRNHVADIVFSLRQAGIAYRAIELESLSQRPVVSDLMQLTVALQTPADRLAWLAVLRAPFCGLSLNDLLRLTENDKRSTVLSLARTRFSSLSADGQQRLQRVLDCLPTANDQRLLYQQVENIWVRLGGAAILSAEDLDAAQLYLGTLAQLEQAGECQGRLDSVNDLTLAVAALYAPPATAADCRVDVMTMHKSKGLQFDVVLLLALERGSPNEDKLLLNIESLSLEGGAEYVLLAPLAGRERADRNGSIYQWLQDLKGEKNKLERVRVLYVAATRAKQRLHLFASLAPNAKGEVKAPSGSLLQPLWADAERHAQGLSDIEPLDTNAEQDENGQTVAPLVRLRADANLPAPTASVQWQVVEQAAIAPPEQLDFDWAGPSAKLVGTLLHSLLQAIAEQGLAVWDERVTKHRSTLEAAVRANLAQHGLQGDELDRSAKQVLQGLGNSLADEQGRWVLSNHPEAVCEYAYSHTDESGAVRRSIIDRSFVADGVRWVVDYKTGGHEGGGGEGFLAMQKERYESQLQRYGDLYAALESFPIKLALYFPMQKTLLSWDYQAD